MKNLLFLLTTICCLGSVRATKDSVFYQIEDYLLDQKIYSARLLVERIEVFENEYQERVKVLF